MNALCGGGVARCDLAAAERDVARDTGGQFRPSAQDAIGEDIFTELDDSRRPPINHPVMFPIFLKDLINESSKRENSPPS